MDDPYSKLKPGDRGKVSGVDDTGTIFVRWDSGSGLGIVYGVDSVKKVEQEIRYETGADFWRDTAITYGIDEALGICGRYLEMRMKMDIPDDEVTFCRELFGAMYEVSASRTDPTKLVYPYDFKKADERMESADYRESRDFNNQCAEAIDAAIHDSCYEPNFYNLRLAAMRVVSDYGFERVNMVLASYIQRNRYDGRYSNVNKKWAGDFDIPESAFKNSILNAHATLIEDFTKYVRQYYEELGAERFALPGREESGAAVQGYEITRAITFDNERGFAIGHNPDAVSPYVCWQITVENGARDFYWGTYSDDEKGAADNFIARVIKHMDGGVKELPDYIATTNTIKESNNEELNNEPTDAERSFAAWTAMTASSQNHWTEDEIYRLNGRGAMYYIGGEDGLYMRIDNGGKLEAGTYEGAVPHIGEATFKVRVTKQYDNFSEAFTAAMSAGGKKFLLDMFSSAHAMETEEAVRKAFENGVFPPVATDKPEQSGYTSVLKTIGDSKKAPKPPRKAKDASKKKTKGDIEL
jgi:hypothetical protein